MLPHAKVLLQMIRIVLITMRFFLMGAKCGLREHRECEVNLKGCGVIGLVFLCNIVGNYCNLIKDTI